MDMANVIKTRKLVEQFLEELPAINDVCTFMTEDRVIYVTLCQCTKCNIINIIVQNKE